MSSNALIVVYIVKWYSLGFVMLHCNYGLYKDPGVIHIRQGTTSIVVKNHSELSIHVCSIHMLSDMSVGHIEACIVMTFGVNSIKQSVLQIIIPQLDTV